MSRLTYSTPLLLVALALSACPGDDVPADTEGSSSGDTTTDPTTMGPTTTPMTTTIDPDSGSGSEDPTSGTTEADPCADVECKTGQECIGGSCFDCAQPTCEPGCEEGETCQCDEGDECCDAGSCAPPVCPLPPLDGNYADCLDAKGVTSDEPCDGAGCVVDNEGNPTAAVCVAAGCEATCQCPAAPATGEAVIACEDVTGDMVNDCWLDCGGGAACPDDMICFGGFICLWSDIAPTEVPLYGDCVNVPGATCADGFCVQAPTGGVCTAPCADAMMDCQPAPLTGDAPPICVDVTGDMMPECILDCSMGQTCADGMECFGGFVCIWPEIIPPDPGFTNCGPVGGAACPMGEDCLDDGMGMVDPTWAVCSQSGCVVAADCTVPAPVTGNAVLTCGDPLGMGAADTCYLDCSMGETCADGMDCINGLFCAWPQGMVIFEEDFESGVFPPGWTRINVDGLTPDAAVAFVDEAWVVVDAFEPAVNFAAYSTSWYNPAGVANDWMVTPAISLGAATTLSWEAWAPDSAFPDGYEVLVSTTGATVADFVDPPVFTIPAEADVFTLQTVDLAAAGYANQDVYIAWRNPSNDQFVLVVDNVTVFELP